MRGHATSQSAARTNRIHRMPAITRPARILIVAGTRPECLKLASVATALRRNASLQPMLVNSGQHEAMVRRTFGHLDIACDVTLPQLQPASLSHAVSALRARIRDCARELSADLLIAQGDTSTAYATALAARDLALPLAHVEAGLRSGHPYRPFPEELFRRRIAPIATLHFAPTDAAVRHLLDEGVPADRIDQVGNSVVDLLRAEVESTRPVDLPFLPPTRDIVTLTLHRRENYGRGLDVACGALVDLLAMNTALGAVCPVHPNPAVGTRIRRHLSGHDRIALVDALDYRPFIALLARSRLAITDSGGIQEEAPYLGTPVLVVRENTERPEAVAIGAATLVPLKRERILAEARRLLANPRPARLPFVAGSAFGDGRSGERIAVRIHRHFHDVAVRRTTQPATTT
jgi:UDP-N-acetylglucosamine 2-epimerase (non-hydrolysing)